MSLDAASNCHKKKVMQMPNKRQTTTGGAQDDAESGKHSEMLPLTFKYAKAKCSFN